MVGWLLQPRAVNPFLYMQRGELSSEDAEVALVDRPEVPSQSSILRSPPSILADDCTASSMSSQVKHAHHDAEVSYTKVTLHPCCRELQLLAQPPTSVSFSCLCFR